MKEKATLIAAFKRLGGEWHEGATTFKWWGSHVGDWPIPVGFTRKDMGKCHHKVSIAGAHYEVGIIELDRLPADHPARHAVDKDGKRVYPDGSFVPMFDFIDGAITHALCGTNPQDPKLLVQAYKTEQMRAAFRKKGYADSKMKEVVDPKTNAVQLEVTTG